MKNFVELVDKWNSKLTGRERVYPIESEDLVPLDMSAMNLDEEWQKRFRLIHEAGGYKTPRLLDFDAATRQVIESNAYAFFFGVF